MIHVRIQFPDSRVHIGNVLPEAFEDGGSDGVHHDVTGGEILLEDFADYTSDDEQLLNIFEWIISVLIAELNISDETEKSISR